MARGEDLGAEVDLAPHRHTRTRSGHEQRMALGHARARHEQVDPRDEAVEVGAGRRRLQVDTERARDGEPIVGHGAGTVIDQRDVVAAGTCPPHDGVAGDAQAEHGHGGQSITPGILMKSA